MNDITAVNSSKRGPVCRRPHPLGTKGVDVDLGWREIPKDEPHIKIRTKTASGNGYIFVCKYCFDTYLEEVTAVIIEAKGM